MKRLFASAAILLPLLGTHDSTVVQAQDKRISKLMMEKLQNSQKLLEGIAMADFKKITRSAEELLALTKTEEWLMRKTQRYELYTNEFRRTMETLQQKAKDKNIDGTTLAFFEMTMSCVRCHQYVREIRESRAPNIQPDGIVVAAVGRDVNP